MKIGRILVAAAALVFAACTDGQAPPTGGTQVLLTDSPFPFDDVAHVNVYIESVDASVDLDTTGTGADWVSIAQPMQAFDLLSLQGGTTAVLGNADIPAGQYRAVRMTIDPSQSHVYRPNGDEVVVHWPVTPSGKIIMHALVEEPLATGDGAKIVIDFDVGRSFLVLESFPTQLVFSPWIRAVNDAVTGTIAGHAAWATDIEGTGGGPLANASIEVYTVRAAGAYGWVAATGRTDALGNYEINYLREGTYHAFFTANTVNGEACTTSSDIQVTAHQTTTRNVVAFPGLGCGGDPIPDSLIVNPDSQPNAGGPVATVSVHVWQTLQPIYTGDSVGAWAELKDAAGAILSGRQVTWSVADTSIVSISGQYGQSLLMRGKAAGATTITATSEGHQGQATITITAGTGGGGGGGGGAGAVNSVTINPATLNPAVGDSIGAYATPRDAGGLSLSGRTVTWSISDSSVVQIQGAFGQSIVMKAKKVGTATLTATSEGKSGTATITVHYMAAGQGGNQVGDPWRHRFGPQHVINEEDHRPGFQHVEAHPDEGRRQDGSERSGTTECVAHGPAAKRHRAEVNAVFHGEAAWA